MAKKKIDEFDQYQEQLVTLEKKLIKESLDLIDNYVSPYDQYFDDGQIWQPLGSGTTNGQSPFDRAGFQNELELTRAREYCRLLAETNEYALNAIENRISYIVGVGHNYDVAPKKANEVDPILVEMVQAYLDEWLYENDWGHKQQENQRRLDRDGEVLIRFVKNKKLVLRYVEPYELYQPKTKADYSNLFGVQVDPDDVETVEGYWINDKLVKPNEIQHRKANVDAKVRRGIPLLHPVKENLRRVDKIYRNMAIVSEIQTAIAMIRKHTNTNQGAVSSFRGNKAAITSTNPTTGKTSYKQVYKPGTILDSSANISYEFPTQGLDASKYTDVAQQILRAVASRLMLPEFMLTSDASNNNYSSVLVAEGPAVKTFQRLQATMARDDLKIIWKVIETAVDNGDLPQEALEQVEVQIGLPSLIYKDPYQEVSKDKILLDAGVMSKQTFAQRNNLDFDQEQKNIQSTSPQADPAKAAVQGVLESLYEKLKEDRHHDH